LDGNEPEFVIMPYENYEKMELGENVPIAHEEGNGVEPVEGPTEEQKTVDKLNQEIMALKEEIRQKESAELMVSNEESEETDEETQVFADTVDLN